MMRKLLSFILLILFTVAVHAQSGISGMTREQFRKYKEDYLKKELNLKDNVCSQFFPLYNEYQNKKQKIYSENQSLMDRADIASEAEYRQIIERLQDLSRASEALDSEYLKKFKTILTYEQIFKLNKAESSFQKHVLKELTRSKGSSKGR